MEGTDRQTDRHVHGTHMNTQRKTDVHTYVHVCTHMDTHTHEKCGKSLTTFRKPKEYMVVHPLWCLSGTRVPQSPRDSPFFPPVSPSHMLYLPHWLRKCLALVQSPAQHSTCKIFPHSMKCQ